MSINKKIIGLILVSFFIVSSVFIANSINALKISQSNNLNLFKAEFLELARESFDNNAYLFFYNLNSEISLINKQEEAQKAILNFVKINDPSSQSIVVVSIADKRFLEAYTSPNLANIFDEVTMKSLVIKYLTESMLNQKMEFDLDNFTEFSSDMTNTVAPKKIHFRVYSDAGLMVGMGEDFASVKTRLGFIERQNKILFNDQIYALSVIFIIILIITVIILIIFLRKVLLIPLNKIVDVVKVIAGGDLTKQIQIKSKDEIGQLGVAFNEMTTKLKESYQVLELKITERTKELQSERGSLEKKVEERTSELEKLKNSLEKTVEERTKNLNSKVSELERMNDLMVGRELKMAELKKEIKDLKDEIKPA